MQTYIIHPLNHLVVRFDTLIGFEDRMCLDKLDKNTLKFKSTKQTSTTHSSLIEFRDSVIGGRGIPEKGWVIVEVEKGDSISDVWKKAMKKVSNKNYV